MTGWKIFVKKSMDPCGNSRNVIKSKKDLKKRKPNQNSFVLAEQVSTDATTDFLRQFSARYRQRDVALYSDANMPPPPLSTTNVRTHKRNTALERHTSATRQRPFRGYRTFGPYGMSSQAACSAVVHNDR